MHVSLASPEAQDRYGRWHCLCDTGLAPGPPRFGRRREFSLLQTEEYPPDLLQLDTNTFYNASCALSFATTYSDFPIPFLCRTISLTDTPKATISVSRIGMSIHLQATMFLTFFEM
jgi:hypothetical protein